MYIPSYTHTHTYSRTTALNLYLSDLFRNLFSISYNSFLDLSALIYIFDFPIYIYIVYGIVRERFETKYSRERERYSILSFNVYNNQFRFQMGPTKSQIALYKRKSNEPKHIEQHSKMNTKNKK